MAGQFLVTLGDASQLPTFFDGPSLKGNSQPRLAFVGRSNVGKSSLINALLDAKLAQTSNKPGKTRCIHFYVWKELKKVVADLPGYGFAAASKTERDRWAQFIEGYLRSDVKLERAVVLLDSRHGPTPVDLDAIQFLRGEGIEINFVFTKIDSLKTQSERASRRKEASQILTDIGYDPKQAHWVSVKTGDGLKILARALAETQEEADEQGGDND